MSLPLPLNTVSFPEPVETLSLALVPTIESLPSLPTISRELAEMAISISRVATPPRPSDTSTVTFSIGLSAKLNLA